MDKCDKKKKKNKNKREEIDMILHRKINGNIDRFQTYKVVSLLCRNDYKLIYLYLNLCKCQIIAYYSQVIQMNHYYFKCSIYSAE